MTSLLIRAAQVHDSDLDTSCDRARRRLLGLGGAGACGVLLGFHWGATAVASTAAAREPLPFDAWIQILPAGRVALLVAKAEMGQGVLTALPMLLAEELEIDFENVEVRQAPIDPSKYDHLTVGSNSIRSLWLPLRRAGAQARRQLQRAAAARWHVAPDACRAARGSVSGPGGLSATYADLAAAAAMLSSDEELAFKPAAQYQIVGRPQCRTDAAAKVSGAAVYGLDVRLPGMLYAVLARCPSPGGWLRSFATEEALTVAGVRAVFPIAPQGRDAFTRGGVAVVAENSWAALQGRRRLQTRWERGAALMDSAALRAQLHAHTRLPGPVVAERGGGLAWPVAPMRVVSAAFELPFLAHATMEPMNATVVVRANGVEAWLPTQNAEDARAAIARVLQRSPHDVTIHQTLLGGGFGRRDATDFAVEAAQVAAALDAPVQLLWSREDDLRFGRYRPMAVHRLRATLDARGFPQAWLHRMSSTSIAAFLEPPETANAESTETGGARDLPYDIPCFRMEYSALRCAVPVGWWRSVEDSLNAFPVECFIDELAGAARRDPLAYRLALLPAARRVATRDGYIETDRLRRVLQAVGEQSGWRRAPAAGRARGLACHACRGSYIAVVAEVSARDGEVRVHRVWAAVDCGTVVNPLGVEAQIDGGLQFGTSAALSESITVRSGAVQQSNFDDYPVLRIDASPRIDVQILPSRAEPGGAGEIAVPAIAPAIANALFALTGRRRRRLPLISRADSR